MSLQPLNLEFMASLLDLWLSLVSLTVAPFTTFMGKFYCVLWFVDLIHLWLKVITFMISFTFMVNSCYIYDWSVHLWFLLHLWVMHLR